MTAEGLKDHGVSSNFAWNDKYTRQLQTLADTDEMTEDILWPTLKDAIKFMLEETFRQWPSSSASILHPAATLIPLQSSSVDDTSLSPEPSRQYGAVASNGHARDGVNENGEGEVEATSNGGVDQNSNQALRVEAEGAYSADNDFSVREVDMQAFFPSKSQAPAQWKGSWGKRIDTEEELNAERRCIFSMLDDFVNQPPFTIQRLSELVLRPTEHHHTLPKYVSALKRLLSVTATRDAFPAHPGDEEDNGEVLLEEEEEDMVMDSQANGAASTTRRTPSVRSRSASVQGSPSSAPLFSPIPFLMRSGDEGMPGGGHLANVEGGLDQAASDESAESRLSFDADVPSMELAGADRTTEQASELAERTGKGTTFHRGLTETEADASPSVQKAADADAEQLERVPQPGLDAVPQQHVAAASTANHEPLGVPSGPVDEVDQIGDRHGQLQPVEPGAVAGGARAFSSTTSNVPSADTVSAAVRSEGQGPTSRKQTTQPTSDTNERTLKRIRSERNLVKSDDKPAQVSEQ